MTTTRHLRAHPFQLPRAALVLAALSGCSAETAPPLRFEVTFPHALRSEPVTGRAYVLVMRSPESDARLRRSFGHQPVSGDTGEPFFAVDVTELRPGQPAVLDRTALGYPVASLADLPAGEYWLQPIFSVYTRFRRSDGHVLWLHEDQWEGQRFAWSPGNLIGEVRRVHLDPQQGFEVRLELTEPIPPVEVPSDTDWVRRVKIESRLLSEFWGRPVHLGATVLLPRGFAEDTHLLYPAIYLQGHFSLEAPFRHATAQVPETDDERDRRLARNRETGYEFHRAWSADTFPRMVAITIQNPTPYFGTSYMVNSANNGPYADAIITELIPYLEAEFRLIPEGYARVLSGASTGGYQALALQVHHPQSFGGAWVFCPDPVSFRRLFTIDIYEDDNAFEAPGFPLLAPPRYSVRGTDGQPLQSVRQLSRLHDALGSRGRSGEYLEAWEAAFGPIGPDGYPRPLWNRATGQIDREVANYWLENGYDLTEYIAQNWTRLGPDLAGKLRFYCGDMDDYYFNLAMYELETVLEAAREPHYAGSFEWGRPMQGHGWRPANQAAEVRAMADHVARNTPGGAEAAPWYRGSPDR